LGQHCSVIPVPVQPCTQRAAVGMEMANLIEHVFVLMLENRAFDHMLGFSGITGHDAANGGSTQINGLTGSEANTFNGRVYGVSRGADDVMPVDPGHEFTNVLEQLCGPGATYPAGGAYPTINNTGSSPHTWRVAALRTRVRS
jgi:phospholipase C